MRKLRNSVGWGLLGMVAWAGCGDVSQPVPVPDPKTGPVFRNDTPAWFREVTRESGLDFVHTAGSSGTYFMPEQIGSGCALFDCDNDGRLDIYLVQNGGTNSTARNQLYRQEEDGTFRNISEGSGLDRAGRGMGVAVGDVNNDGFNDVLLTEFGSIHLFLNQGQGRFRDATADSRLHNPRWATCASFLDYDRDGRLDLVVGNYSDYDATLRCYNALGEPDFCGPHDLITVASRLYRNQGEVDGKVVFQDVTIDAGLVHHPGPALGVVCADFNSDGWVDIFFADDVKPNRLFLNETNGTFREEAGIRGLAFTALGQVAADMGIGIQDVNQDGLFDIFITHLTSEFHNLWIQGPEGSFQDQTAQAGLTRPSWRGTGFGTVMEDFNLDGAPDIALVNGRIRADRYDTNQATTPLVQDPFWLPYAQRSQLLENDGQGRFRDISTEQPVFCQEPMVGRGLAVGDVDNDGDLDILTTAISGPARLFRNEVSRTNRHWLMIRAVDPALGGRDTIGARLRVRAGNRERWGLIQPGGSFLSSHDPRAHFGLGQESRFEGIEVTWPDGKKEAFPGGPADRLVTLRKGQGK